MRHRIAAFKRQIAFLLALTLPVTALPTAVLASGSPVRVVILGSSTAAGANATPLDSSWVSKYARHLAATRPGSEVFNLAVGGLTTFNIMPTESSPAGSWNQPEFQPAEGNNISAALALDPDLIIVNLPTNDCAVDVPIDLQMNNCATIVREAAERVVPVWITTSQPRYLPPHEILLLRGLYNSTYEAFPDRTIDFWTGLADEEGYIVPEYNSDGVHLNNAGHSALFDRVVGTVEISQVPEPFIAMHPRARSVMAGDTTAFEVIGFGHDPIEYQWQRNGVDIPGETDSRLVINGAVVIDSGAIFSCVATNGSNTVSSNGARLVVQPLPGPPSSALRSDDFVTGVLDPTIWSFENPKNDADLSFTGLGTDDVWLTLHVPGGATHDVWTGANNAPRILQPMANEDFEVQAKFASAPSSKYQMQGIIIQNDDLNLVRFDVVRMTTHVHIFAASFVDGIPTVWKDSILSGGAPMYLRLRRTSSAWTGSFSYDGITWTTTARFTFAMTTTAAGVFAGNSGESPGATPAFTAHVDYFFNDAAPIEPEDVLPTPSSPVLCLPAAASENHPLTLDLVWSSTGDAMDSLQVSTDTTSWSTPLISVSVPAATPVFRLDTLLKGATYAWRVRTSRYSAWSAWSAPSTFSTVRPRILLRRSPTGGSHANTPDVTWADATSDSSADWSFGTPGSIGLFIRSSDAVTFSACTVTVRWDPRKLSYRDTDLTGALAAGASMQQTTIDTLQGTLTFHATFPGTLSLVPEGAFLARLNFTSLVPGRTFITAEDLRFGTPLGATLARVVATVDTMAVTVLLGDVASPGGDETRADGRVDFEDLSAWSLSYWSTDPGTRVTTDGYRRKYDIGPTSDGTPRTFPVPDGIVNFEDLMIMALMYGADETSTLPKTVQQNSAQMALETGNGLEDGATTITPVMLRGTVTDLHGIAVRIPGIADRFVGIAAGALLSSMTPGAILFHRVIGQDVEVHIAAGPGRAIGMGGELFTIRLRSSGPFSPELSDARDSHNSHILVTASDEAGSDRPTAFALAQNYPNPFNPSTTISYAMPVSGHVTIRVFNILGAEVAKLVDGERGAGVYRAVFDASTLPSGMYVYRMQVRLLDSGDGRDSRTGSGDFTASRKLLLVR